MSKSQGMGLLAAAVLTAAITGGGCVSAENHRAALSDLQRLRVEAWQRSVEAAALRAALDRAAAENAQLRAYGAQASAQAMTALAARVEEVSRKQDAMADELRAAQVCAPAPTGVVPASAQAVQQPKQRKVTDLLYSRF